MLIAGFPAGDFQTNCYLVATAPGSEALVVDPGQNALPGIEELCARHRLRPVAALLTRGHATFRVPGTLLAGDLVFKGSIGRVDLPGNPFLADLVAEGRR